MMIRVVVSHFRMGPKAVFGALIVASIAAMVIAAVRHTDPTDDPVVPPKVQERPWLTPEAAAQVATPDGGMGPLFAGVELGGAPPSQEVRARIAEFARAHDVDIRFEVVGGELAAVRFTVTFGGCCGYEGADAFARRLDRPRTETDCCHEGGPPEFVDDWAFALDHGVHVRAHVHVNRVDLRWEQTMSTGELLDRTDALLGKDRESLRATAGDRWNELPLDHAILEVPYPFAPNSTWIVPSRIGDRDDLGLVLTIERGRIVEISFAVRAGTDVNEEDARNNLIAQLRGRWGRPRGSTDTTWTWRKADRTITAERYNNHAPDATTIVIHKI